MQELQQACKHKLATHGGLHCGYISETHNPVLNTSTSGAQNRIWNNNGEPQLVKNWFGGLYCGSTSRAQNHIRNTSENPELVRYGGLV